MSFCFSARRSKHSVKEMGASVARLEDARLNLAVPVYTEVGSRRMLDPSVKSCPLCGRRFSLFMKRHYCRRCGRIVCEFCTIMRKYKNQSQYCFRVCKTCNRTPLLQLSQRVWHLVLSFAGTYAHHWSLQTCRKLQLSTPLPREWQYGPDWNHFFTDGVFLSRGANGAVFKARLKGDNSRGQVAVKSVMKKTIFSLRKWHHIFREIDVLKKCSHPNIIQLINHVQCPDAVYIVLEYAKGGDLFEWLVSREVCCEADVVPIAWQLLEVLRFMHDECNAVHRDIKPENILLECRYRPREPARIKLADFGFARVFPQNSEKRTTEPKAAAALNVGRPSATSQQAVAMNYIGALNLSAPDHQLVEATPCGTLGFAAPEVLEAYHTVQVEQRQRRKKAEEDGPGKIPSNAAPSAAPAVVTERSAHSPKTNIEILKKMDIFAAGVTIAILLTGCEPFPCESSQAHIRAVSSGINFCHKQWARVSSEARDLLQQMLAPVALQRPRAADILKHKWFALRNYKLRTTASPTTPVPVVPTPQDIKIIANDVKQLAQSLRTQRRAEARTMYDVDPSTGGVILRKRAEFVEEAFGFEPPGKPAFPNHTTEAAEAPERVLARQKPTPPPAAPFSAAPAKEHSGKFLQTAKNAGGEPEAQALSNNWRGFVPDSQSSLPDIPDIE